MDELSIVDPGGLSLSIAKRRRIEDAAACWTFPFSTFADPGCPCDYHGAFRDNIRHFLHAFAHREPHDVAGLHPSWRINLLFNSSNHHYHLNHSLSSSSSCKQMIPHDPLTLPLFFVEENVHISGHDPRCQHCRSAGWGDQLVAKRQYHVIIPADEYMIWDAGAEPRDGSTVDTVGGVQRRRLFLLYGVLHCNGYGHLLSVNGRENGSRHAHGREFLDLWDRLCSMLRAREVSVEDVARKRGMELRLIHSVAYREPWFARWGYRYNKFRTAAGIGGIGGGGGAAIAGGGNRRLIVDSNNSTENWKTKKKKKKKKKKATNGTYYAMAIEAIRGMPLTVMAQLYERIDRNVLAIVSAYQRMSAGVRMSGTTLQTLGDLVRYMMELRTRLPPPSAAAPPPPNFRSSSSFGAANFTSGSSSSNQQQADRCSKARLISPRRKPRRREEPNIHQLGRGGAEDSSNINNGAKIHSGSSSTSAGSASGGGGVPCRWSSKRLELATEVIVGALKSSHKKWMPRQDVRDAARLYIGDTGLLDYVLKSLGNRVVGDYVVRRTVNPITKVLEYSLEDLPPPPSVDVSSAASAAAFNSDDVLTDLLYIYRNVLERFKPAFVIGASDAPAASCSVVASAIPTAARIVLDATHMLKKYRGEMTRKCAEQKERSGSRALLDVVDDDDELLRVMCSVRVRSATAAGFRCDLAADPPPLLLQLQHDGQEGSWRLSAEAEEEEVVVVAAELVVVPPHATIGDLKEAAEKAFRETYEAMEGLRLEGIEALEGVGDEELLFGNIESGAHVVAYGTIEAGSGGGAISESLTYNKSGGDGRTENGLPPPPLDLRLAAAAADVHHWSRPSHHHYIIDREY